MELKRKPPIFQHAQKYTECPMRHKESGNCLVVGGFCADAISDEICEALHQAYDKGFIDGAEKMKQHLLR
jgi:hypothetical protein